MNKPIADATIRHLMTVVSGVLLTSTDPSAKILSGVVLVLALVWSIVEKIKVQRTVDGYEVTIQQYRELKALSENTP